MINNGDVLDYGFWRDFDPCSSIGQRPRGLDLKAAYYEAFYGSADC